MSWGKTIGNVIGGAIVINVVTEAFKDIGKPKRKSKGNKLINTPKWT